MANKDSFISLHSSS